MDLLKLKNLGWNRHHDDDQVDRFNHKYTVLLILGFLVFITAKEQMGTTIACWCPAQYNGNYIKYVHEICKVTNIHYNYNTSLKFKEVLEFDNKLLYYQWMPMILILLGAMNYLPVIFWRIFNKKSGIDISNMLKHVTKCSETQSEEQKNKSLELIVKFFDLHFESKKIPIYDDFFEYRVLKLLYRVVNPVSGQEFKNYLTVLYLTVKGMYVTSISLQMLITDVLFSSGKLTGFGFRVLQNYLNNELYKDAVYFPRIIFCRYYIRELGITFLRTVQCVLPMNMYAELLFVFFYFWLVLLLIVNVASFYSWMYLLYVDKISYVRKYIDRDLRKEPNFEKYLKIFVKDYLYSDGVFLVRTFSHNYNHFFVSDLVSLLFYRYKKITMAKEKNEKELRKTD